MRRLLNITLVTIYLILTGNHIAYSQNNEALMILMVNPKYAGETSQMKGVARYLTENMEKLKKPIEIMEIDADDTEKAIKLLQAYQGSSKPIVIASGNTGIDILKGIKSKAPSILSVYLSHQLFNNYETLIKTPTNPNGVNLMVLPKHVITPDLRKTINKSDTTLLDVIGVAHNLTKQELLKEYGDHKAEIPGSIQDNYTVVILGGDAENTDGSWLYFTKNDALSLAKKVEKSLPKDGYLFVLNGPRTGKHSSDGGEDQEAHRSDNLDSVTQAFADYFKNNKKLQVFNFIYGKHGMYKAVLGKVAEAQSSTLWVPGESTSMISEIVDSLGNDKKVKILVYEHGAMNRVHKAHIKSEYESGRIRIVDNAGKVSSRAEFSEGVSPTSSAAKIAADEIARLLQ